MVLDGIVIKVRQDKQIIRDLCINRDD